MDLIRTSQPLAKGLPLPAIQVIKNNHTVPIRPYTLVEGEYYAYRDHRLLSARSKPIKIKFLAYTACPAIVVVLDGSTRRVRCPRDDLFVINSLPLT